MRHILVIGAGASGMMAAITAARAGCRVTILEHTSRSGRKLELTGNGKCNFTNSCQELSCYHTHSRAYLETVFRQFSYENTLAFFEELGIVPKCRNGYYYPYSGQAQAVSQALRREAERLGVKFACNVRIIDIKKDQVFHIKTIDASLSDKPRRQTGCSGAEKRNSYTYTADAVILAAGSKAASFTGSDGSGYQLAGKLGHKLRKPLPALVPLGSLDKEIALLAGLRTEGTAKLLIDGQISRCESGELQFVKNGLSGIPVFQISTDAARALDEGKKVSVQMNFLSGTGWDNIPEQLQKRRERFLAYHCSINDFLNGLLHERAAKAVCSRMAVKGSRRLESLDEQSWKILVSLLQGMEFSIHETGSFDKAQVCSGGVLLEQLHEGTLESKIISRFYFAGEILDVDGACGGYNLQWAWASGYVSGSHAAKD